MLAMGKPKMNNGERSRQESASPWDTAASALTPNTGGVNAVEISGLTPWKKGR